MPELDCISVMSSLENAPLPASRKNIHKFITGFIFADFQFDSKNVIFGFQSFEHKDRDAFLFIDMSFSWLKSIFKSKIDYKKS